MSPLIYSLVPRSYIKKNHKTSIEFRDVDNFIVELRRRIVDCWNYRFEVDGTSGTGYKLKFEQFEKKFLKKSDFVCYIVNSTSEEAFKNCLGKLVKSCKNSEKLKNVIVISLDLSLTELDCTPIKYIYFGNDWLSENACQWTKLENILKDQVNIDPYDGEKDMSESPYLTIPKSNCGRKSPSKIKNFFHSLPSKFDIEKTRTLFAPKSEKEYEEVRRGSHHDIRLPDINVSDTDRAKYNENNHTAKHKHKDEHSKLSFNSLFRRRSKKARDSGLSMGSSNSNGSSSRNSESIANCGSISADPIFDSKEQVLSHAKQPHVFHTASVSQTERHKGRIVNFKTKAHKAIRSTSCLSNNKTKGSKYQVKEVVNKVIDFSTNIISASSDIGNRSENINANRKKIDRGQSEPPMNVPNGTYSDPQLSTRIKYYSWNEDSFNEKDSIEDKSSSNNLGIDQPVLSNAISRNTSKSDEQDNEADILKEMTDDFSDESPFSSVNRKNKCEDESAVIDDDFFFNPLSVCNSKVPYTDVNQYDSEIFSSTTSYKTFLNQQTDNNTHGTETSEISTNSFTTAVDASMSNVDSMKDDPMESLNVLIKSIQTSCAEMRTARKSHENNDDMFDTNEELDDEFVEDSEQDVNGMNTTFEDEPLEVNETIENIEESKTVWLESEITNTKVDNSLAFNWESEHIEAYREMSPELISVADSIDNKHFYPINVRDRTHYWIRNPLLVTGLFAATTYMAPIWCTYIPRDASFLNIFTGTVQYLLSNEIVQSIPNQIISTSRSGVVAATQTVKRFLILLPSTPWLYPYRALPV